MKPSLYLFVFFYFFGHCQSPSFSLSTTEKDLLLIEEHGKFGLINENGDEILPPIYDRVKTFSHGLAAVALNGVFGFINTDGEYVIEPQFHAVKNFNGQYAEAMLDGKWFKIDRNGNTKEEKETKVKPKREKLLNKNAQFTLDSSRANIVYTQNGKYIIGRAKKIIEEGRPRHFFENALIDTFGQMIIPFGKYDEIRLWKENEFLFINKEGREIIEQGILNGQGNISHKISHVDPIGNLENGIAISRFKGKDAYGGGAIGSDGEWVLRDKNINHIKMISQDRLEIKKREGAYIAKLDGEILNEEPFAYVNKIIHDKYPLVAHRKSGKYFLTNMDGRFLTDEPIHFLQDDAIEKDFIIVRKDTSYFKFNKSGEFIPLSELDPFRVAWYKKGYYLLTYKKSTKENYRIGWYNPLENSIVKPRFVDIKYYRTSSDFYWVKEDGRWGYADKWGHYIWQGKKDDALIKPFAFSKTLSNYKPHKPRKLNKWVNKLLNRVYARVSYFSTLYNKEYEGKKIYISNTTNENMDFRLDNGRLTLIMQAKDEKGEWRNVEAMNIRGIAICGTGERRSWTLPPGHYWSFRIPKYDGVFKTKFRMVLKQFPDWEEEEGQIWISNEFNGGVNPGQFYGSYPGM